MKEHNYWTIDIVLCLLEIRIDPCEMLFLCAMCAGKHFAISF